MTRLSKQCQSQLTHWGRVTHICVGKLTIIDSDNGLSPERRQAIIWTNAGILLIGALGTNVSEILIKICTFSLKKMLLKMSSGKRRPSCLGLNVLMKQRCVMGLAAIALSKTTTMGWGRTKHLVNLKILIRGTHLPRFFVSGKIGCSINVSWTTFAYCNYLPGLFNITLLILLRIYIIFVKNGLT